jgi:tight adherence protein C
VIAEALSFAAAATGAAAVAELRPRRERARPFALVIRAGKRLLPRAVRAPAELERRLLEAGRPGGMGATDLLAAKVGVALAATAAGLLAGAVLPGRIALLAAVASPVAGFMAPDVWLARRRAERVAQVRRDMPALLDLLGVAVEAGLPLARALTEVGRRSHAPLARAWEAIAAQVGVGVPLLDALESHRRELALPEIDSFAGALARAARHGAPLGDTLAAQAREVRVARRRAIQEEAARAGPKMQLVVALLLVPSVMLLVAAALLGALAGSAGVADMLTGY